MNFKIFKAVRLLTKAEKRTLGTVDSIRGRLPSSSHNLDAPSDSSERSGRLKVRLRRISLSNHSNSKTRRKTLIKETKAIKTLTVITGAFLINWSPFFILALIKPICSSCYIPPYLDKLFLWLGWLNSAVNPLIYAKFNRDFRIPFREMLCCRFKSLQSVMRREEFVETFGGSTNDINSIALQRKFESSTFENLNLTTTNGTIPSQLDSHT